MRVFAIFAAAIWIFGLLNDPVMPETFEKDLIKTTAGELEITFIGHGTLMFRFQGRVIHVDPVSREADYSKLPKADIILVTHEHGDHLDLPVIDTLRTKMTEVLVTSRCAARLQGVTVMKNGDVKELGTITVEAVPAYNILHKRSNGNPYHPKGEGNGYIISFADKRVYVAGDTENIPEMKALKNIDVAFLPMNLPYTMSPEMVAEAVRAFKPKILYPYHYGRTDPKKVVELLKDFKIDVRIRKLD